MKNSHSIEKWKAVIRKLSRYRTIDGAKYVRKTGPAGITEYIPVSDKDPDQYYERALFFGIFGAHKFEDGETAKGLLYFVSFGCFGVFWAADILAILLGNYRLPDGSYLDHPEWRRAFLLLPAGIVVNAGLIWLYIHLGAQLFEGLQKGIQSGTASLLNDSSIREKIFEESGNAIR